MADLTIYHNPKCSSSRNAIAVADDLGIEYETVLYLQTPPDQAALTEIIEQLDDPVADLVRKDVNFKKLGLDAGDYQDASAVIDLLLAHPELMQRPLLRKGGQVIIGRPKERVPGFLA